MILCVFCIYENWLFLFLCVLCFVTCVCKSPWHGGNKDIYIYIYYIMTSTMYMFFLFNKIPPPISSKLFRRIWNETSWRTYTCIQLSKLQTHSRGWILVSKLTMNFQQDFQNTSVHYRNMESSCSWTKRNSLKEKFVTEKRQLEEKKSHVRYTRVVWEPNPELEY